MAMFTPEQLALNVYLNDEATFENFFSPESSANYQVLQAVKNLVLDNNERFLFLWGNEGSGISHLMQAACHAASENNLSSQYLPLEDLVGYAPDELLDGLEQLDMVCLDGIHLVMGQPGWDEAMFHLYNRLRDKKCRMLVSANCPPRELGSHLPDLSSRMGWGVVYRMMPLSDEEKKMALIARARARGLEMGEEVAQYILHRAQRDMDELFLQLERLDKQSMSEQRKLTVPFVKAVLGL
ncbi:MAG: DnaA regulatory inactivator Hda [Pseudomonadales bacterium]|nr:DnaA regulatory inactivator Hda [Pseudomonadales bacterium]